LKITTLLACKASGARALLEAVPRELHGDPGYIFSKIQLLRREEKFAEAAQLMLSAPRDPGRLHNLDEWWIERRLLSRKMLDVGEHRTAYLIARDAALPARDIYKTEQEFTAGWIALRFLTDTATAAQHFARIGVGSVNPTTLARAGYWQGRTAEAAGRYYAEEHGLSVICLRIGTVNQQDRPRNPREYATLLTHRDLVQLVRRCFEAPLDLRFAGFYGVSRNTWRIWDIEDAGSALGFAPVDDAERFR